MDPIMSVLDADTNSVISATELEGASAALAKLDTDSDGTLSAAELTPKRAGAGNRSSGGPSGFVPPLLKALDADGDGALSKEEIANAAAALKTLDKNGDGQLSRDEIMPQRPDGPGAGPGRGGR
jgi:hypothetical protein